MLLKNKINNINSIIKPDSVLTSLEERYCYSTDALNRDIDTKLPEAVVFVETIEDVVNIVKFAHKNKIPLVSRGAGTNMVGACTSTEGGIILNFSKMNKILEINPSNMSAKVQPGVILGDLKSEVEKLNLFYPPDPSNYKVSTIGGSIAQSSGGAMAYKYGTTKDYVLSLKVVTADGTLMTLGAETAKDSVGYHLAQLMIGSEGTLAIIVEATLKLIPKPESRKLVVSYFNDIANAMKAINSLVSKNIFPASIDFMDKNSLKTVNDFLQCNLDIESDCMLLIDLDGKQNTITDEAEEIKKLFIFNGANNVLLPDANESEIIWNARRASYAAAARLAPDIISDDIIVPRDKLVFMIKKCNEIADKYKLKMCLVGHIGDGNLHPQIALNLEDEEEYRRYCSAKSEIYSHVKNLNGTISAEHGVGIEKKSYLGNTIDKNSIEYMKIIKKAFDPDNILNPGKIFTL